MNIKQGKSTFKMNIDLVAIRAFFLGGGKNNNLYQYTIIPTIGIWFATFIMGSIVYLIGGTDMVYLETITVALMVSGISGFGVTSLSLMGTTEYNAVYGWGIWRRSMFYNMIFFSIFYTIYDGVTVDAQREKITSFEMSTTDVRDCEYKVTMKSKTLIYDHCSSYDHTQTKIKTSENMVAYLIGKVRYGTNKADHYEFVDKLILVKEQ